MVEHLSEELDFVLRVSGVADIDEDTCWAERHLHHNLEFTFAVVDQLDLEIKFSPLAVQVLDRLRDPFEEAMKADAKVFKPTQEAERCTDILLADLREYEVKELYRALRLEKMVIERVKVRDITRTLKVELRPSFAQPLEVMFQRWKDEGRIGMRWARKRTDPDRAERRRENSRPLFTPPAR